MNYSRGLIREFVFYIITELNITIPVINYSLDCVSLKPVKRRSHFEANFTGFAEKMIQLLKNIL
jgi:6-phosphogluconolactonase (cycloisomerase 2 family)